MCVENVSKVLRTIFLELNEDINSFFYNYN